MFDTKIKLTPTLTLTIKKLSTQQLKFALYLNDKFYMSNIPATHIDWTVNQLIEQYKEVGE